MKLKNHSFHFIGIGGIGMCGLAELLHTMGAKVSGSDLSHNANTDHLLSLGISVHLGHASENVEDVDVVVYSSAVRFNNPEILEAKKKKIPLIPRAEALAEIMRFKRGIAVGGTHGKTTTTSLLSTMFIENKKNPTIMVGGRLGLIQSTARLGNGEWMIAEADESDGSFHKLSPEIAIITNIDSDHLDHFKTFENLERAFFDFANKVPFYGLSIVCGDNIKMQKVFENYSKKIIFYGFEEHNHVRLVGSHGEYELFEKDLRLGSFKLQLPGKHNALNATAAILAGLHSGLSFNECAQGIEKFSGVDRRFHYKGEKSDIKVYDDYGHHPTEVQATLQAFREKFPKQRICVLFQPHRYSRTELCWTDFLTSFKDCDLLMISDIYAASESPIPGITSERLVLEIENNNKLYVNKENLTPEFIKKKLKPGDVFVTLGAGDGWKLGLALLEAL
jgi:UDP-N-acetylmuramate--alanine ligase